MNATTDLLRGELERLFELEEMKQLSEHLLGVDPDDVGGTAGKGAFARALVDHCADAQTLEALADAIVLSTRDKGAAKEVHRALTKDEQDLASGAEVGGFTVRKKLGEGGVGVVYLAERKDDDDGETERVAIKVIKQQHCRDRTAVERFLTACRALRRIEEDGVAPVINMGVLEDGRPWVATRFMDNQALASRLGRVGPMHVNEARPVITSVLKALGVLHEHGFVHGDVKVENAFVRRDKTKNKDQNQDQDQDQDHESGSDADNGDGAKAAPTGVLVDGGTDRLFNRADADGRAIGALVVPGTAKAFDPELARGKAPSAQSDLYAAATMFYEMLTGRAPFEGDSALEVIAQHLTAELDAPSVYAPKGWIREDLDAVVLKALARDPAERYPSVRAFAEAVEAVGRSKTDDALADKEDFDEEAFEEAAEALRESPADEDKAVALERVAAPAHEWKKAVTLLLEVVDKIEDDDDVKKALLFRAARLEEADLHDRDAAEAIYNRILEIDPEDDIAQIGIEELKRSSGNSEDLVDVLLEKAERAESASERASVLGEIARIYEHELESPDDAFVAWVHALASEPTNKRIVHEVERLADSPERWNEAAESVSEAAQQFEEPAAVAASYALLGRWYATHLKRSDFALQCFTRVLDADPANDDAYEGLAELYRKSQSWKELVELLTRRAEVTSNPVRGREFRLEKASLLLRKLSEKDRATDIYQQIHTEDPGHPVASDALELIYAERENWKELIALLEDRSHHQKGEERLATLLRLAEMYEDRMDDVDKATVHYESVLAHEAGDVAALKGLERIYAKAGKYKELLENLNAQLASAATPRQKVALLERIGNIQEEEFVDHEKAAAAFEQIVEIEPSHDTSNTALERMYRKLQRFDDLADTYDRHAKGTEDKERKLELLMSAIKVLTADVGAPDRALAVAERVLSIQPDHMGALEVTAHIKATSGDAAAAVEAVERLAEAEKDGVKRAALWVRAGRFLEEKDDKDAAIDRYKKALDADAKSADAAAALRAIYSARGDAHGAVELLQSEIDATEGAISRAELYVEMGTLYRERLEDDVKARDALKKAIELDATCTPAAQALSEMAFKEQNWSEAARYAEPLLARTGDMPPSVAREVSLLCGDAFRELREFSRAQRAYLNAKAFAPDDREVLERVAEITFESGEADEAAELYRDLKDRFSVQLVGGDKGRVYYRLGEACRRAGNLDEAIPSLNQAAELLPEDPKPLEALIKVHEAQEKWEFVVRTLRRRMEQVEEDARVDLVVRIGDVQLEKIKDRRKASETYVSALEMQPDNRNVLTKMMAIYSEGKDWSKLVEVILRIAELVDDSAQLSKYYRTAAAISHRELGRLEEATDYYEQALEHDPKLETAFEGLVDCLGKREDHEALADAYRAQLERFADGEPERKAALWDSLGDILRERLDKKRDALEAYEKALEHDPDNRRRIELLADLYADDAKKYFPKAVRAHGLLLDKSPYRIESYQALRQLYTDMKRPDESWCVCQALMALNMAEPDEESFFKKHRTRRPAEAQEFFSEELWFHHLTHQDQDPLLTGIFAMITPAVMASRAQPLERFEVRPEDKRDPAKDEAAMAQTLHYAGGVTEIPLPDVYYRQSDAGGLSFIYTSPPAIGLGQGALAGGPSQALAFVAGRHLTYFRPGFFLRHLVPTGSGLRAWLLAAIKAIQPQFPVPGDLQGPVADHLGALKQHLTGQALDELHSLVQKLLAASPSLDMKRWVAAVDLTADRVGFVLANSLDIALAVVRASPDEAAGVGQKDRLKELHLYAVSEPYLELRRKLGVAIGQ